MPLVEPSQDSLVPQMQANLTRCPQLPRRASALTVRPAGARRLHTGAGRAPSNRSRVLLRGCGLPSCCRGLRLYFMVWLLGLRRASLYEGLIKLIWRLEFKALGHLPQEGTAERGG